MPPAFAALYGWIYAQFLRSSKNVLSASAPDGRLVWWSWFVICGIGLSASTYVLAGVEAGVLMTPYIDAKNSKLLQIHKDKSWSKIGGWSSMLYSLFRSPEKRGSRYPTSWVWTTLFVLSFLSWAFPLSGLTMEMAQSYKPGSVAGVQVVGAQPSRFDQREAYDLLEDAHQQWATARQPRMPLIGALYSDHEDPIGNLNMTSGNTFPAAMNGKVIFLAAQAGSPITGESWGMRLKLSCVPVYTINDFKILNQRINLTTPGYMNFSSFNYVEFWEYRTALDREELANATGILDHVLYNVTSLPGATVSVLRHEALELGADLVNRRVNVIAEVGLSAGLDTILHRYRNRGYIGEENDDTDMLELALWQYKTGSAAIVRDEIPELTGEYIYKTTFGPDSEAVPLKAIGTQCRSSSAVGVATIDGLSGTFKDFHPEPIPSSEQYAGIPRLGLSTPAMFLPRVRVSLKNSSYIPLNHGLPWISGVSPAYQYVQPGLLAREDPVSTWKDSLFSAAATGTSPFLTTETLRQAVEAAFHHTAISLMYGQLENKFWRHANLTAAVPWTTIVPANGVPPLLIMVALGIWALGCVVLGLMFSFRKRWDAFFSTGSMFWYCKMIGVDPEEVMRKID